MSLRYRHEAAHVESTKESKHTTFFDTIEIVNTSETSPAPTTHVSASQVRSGSRVVIIGGGPGGYEAALTAAQLGANVTLIERRGAGGSAVLTDVVPSKTLIASADWLSSIENAAELGIVATKGDAVHVDFARINARVKALAAQQSADIHARLVSEGITVITGRASICPTIGETGTRYVRAVTDTETLDLEAEFVLVATGASPRELPSAVPDGERILSWTQLYDLTEIPSHLVVVGSGVTGLEFAGAYLELGVPVTLVSSRDRVLPGEDPEAAEVIEDVYGRRGMTILGRSRAEKVERTETGVSVHLTDGTVVEASHCLMAVGAVPNTSGIGLVEAGVKLSETGHIVVDKVSRTTAFRIYAAGDATGVYPLASVAAMQGRIAMNHALGDAVMPLDVGRVTANVFTSPEIATAGITAADVEKNELPVVSTIVPLARNPRVKMKGLRDGFVKLFADDSSRVVLGGVVVAPHASEHILSVAMAVTARLTVDEFASVFTIYPSLSGSITEAARQLHASK